MATTYQKVYTIIASSPPSPADQRTRERFRQDAVDEFFRDTPEGNAIMAGQMASILIEERAVENPEDYLRGCESFAVKITTSPVQMIEQKRFSMDDFSVYTSPPPSKPSWTSRVWSQIKKVFT